MQPWGFSRPINAGAAKLAKCFYSRAIETNHPVGNLDLGGGSKNPRGFTTPWATRIA